MITDTCDPLSFAKDEPGETTRRSKGGTNFHRLKDHNFNKDSCNCPSTNGLPKHKPIDRSDVETKVGSDTHPIEGEEKPHVGSFINNKNSCHSISEKKPPENNPSPPTSGYKDEPPGKPGGNPLPGGNPTERKLIGPDNVTGKPIVFDPPLPVNGDKKDPLTIEIHTYKKTNLPHGISGTNHNGRVPPDVIPCNDRLLVPNKENCLPPHLLALPLRATSDTAGKAGKGTFERPIHVKVCVLPV